MEAVAHSPAFAKKVGVPQSVGKDYATADKGKTFGKGDDMKRMAFGGETASDKKAKTRLANMREEDAEVAEGRQNQQREDRLERYRRNIAINDLKIAQKQGKTYDKWFEDNRKAQLKDGILRQDAYDEGKGYEMLTPTQHRQALTSSGMKKGGEVKESKAMVGKEVAFMKKKGAPAKMVKHEMSEMKGMKAGGKVRRMAGGGAADYLDSLENEDYAKQKEQGAKNLKSLKSFFGFGDKEEPAPVDRSRDIDRTVKPTEGAAYTRPLGITKTQSPRTSSGNSAAEDEVERSDAAMMAASRDKTAKGPQYTSNSNQGETDFGYESQSGTKTGSGASGFPSGYKDSGFSALTPAKKRKPVGIEKVEKKERVITEPVDTSYSSLEARRASKKPEETKPESKSARKFGMASDETRASVRKGLGSVLDFFDLSKAHEREFGKKMAKGGNVKMSEGGFTREADGVAKKGKTQGKVVKMASGGFVKTADGCAQRGKTKAFQVKMNRGGMC
jgi:hypothetical protein